MNLQKTGAILKRELLELIPPTLFFLVAFGLLLITQMLVLEEHGIDAWDWGGAVVGALVVGKVVLITDKFDFIDRYPDEPLIYNALWKTLIYMIAASIVHYLEELLPLVFHGKGFVAANRALIASFDWHHAALIHMWLLVLLFGYCSLRELVRHIGPAKVARMFFHSRHA